MIISRFNVAKTMLRDVFDTWDDWHDELGTVTGFSWGEYVALDRRLSTEIDVDFSAVDEDMLNQAANQFFGYPAIRTLNMKGAFGNNWKQVLDNAFRSRRDF